MIDPALHDACRLYRTIDFFAAASTISNRALMFTRADAFPDRNEGVELILAAVETHVPGGCSTGWSDLAAVRRRHEAIKRSYYVSCWSLDAESVAMWSLYSPDQSSVRISTTVGKLRAAVCDLLERYAFTRFTHADCGTQVTAAVEGRIAPVRYASLAELATRVSRRAKAHERIAARYQRNGKPMPGFDELPEGYWLRAERRRIVEIRSSFNLKDGSFRHEREVRAAVRLGRTRCSERVLEMQQFVDPSHPYHSIVRPDLELWGYLDDVAGPSREFARCPARFVDDVALDPRCPPHKAEFMRGWFAAHGVPVVDSTCFGYVPERLRVFPQR